MSDQSLPLTPVTASCGCSDHGAHADPELDARLIPHQIRHGAIFGALDSLPTGSAMVLVAPHDPVPLLRQIDSRYEPAVTVEYLERGPEAWKLRLVR